MFIATKTCRLLAGIALTLCTSSGVTLAQSNQPYIIGYISDFSGPFVDTFSPVYDGFRAHIGRVNAAGGINGHKLVLKYEDDQVAQPLEHAARCL